MNATAETLSRLRAYQRERNGDIPAALRVIRSLGELFGNDDTLAEDAALTAFQSGREAYWSKAGYSNQRASRILSSANVVGLAVALRHCADDSHPSHAARSPYLLGSLIPLNKPAQLAIERAWSEME